MAAIESRPTKPAWPLAAAFGAAAGATIAAYAGLLALYQRTGTLSEGSTPATIGWMLFAFAAYLGLLVVAERGGGLPLRWFWLLAIAARLLLLGTSPTLSPDSYHYLWAGHVAVNGVSPYAYTIDAPELDFLDHPIRAQANNTWMASPYPPVAQAVFWFTARWLSLTPLSLQILMVLCDLLTAVLIGRLLSLVGLPRRRLLLYLLNPLVVVEVAQSAHIDAWMALLTLMAVWAMLAPAGRRRGWLAPVLLALAINTKVLPLLLAPLFFWRWTWRQRFLCGLVVLLPLLPAGLRAGWGLWGDLDGTGLFGASRIYVRQWQFNSGLFHWLMSGLDAAGVPGAARWAGAATSLCLVGALAVIWWRGRGSQDDRAWLRQLGAPLAAMLLLTPTVHPWYLLVVLVFVPFWPPAPAEGRTRWLAALPWLWLSGTLVFSYLSYSDPTGFRELNWVRALEWIPTWLLLIMSLAVARRILVGDTKRILRNNRHMPV